MQKNQKEFFTVTLYTCYEYLRPDVVLEYAWRFGLYEYAMPFMIQLIRELNFRVETVHKKHEDREKKEEKQAEQQMNRPLDVDLIPMAMPMTTPMLMPAPPMGMGTMSGMATMPGMVPPGVPPMGIPGMPGVPGVPFNTGFRPM